MAYSLVHIAAYTGQEMPTWTTSKVINHSLFCFNQPFKGGLSEMSLGFYYNNRVAWEKCIRKMV